jgi:hypothetical protein
MFGSWKTLWRVKVAVDCPVSNSSRTHHILSGAEAAPKGSTALVLCCATLAMETWLAKKEHRPRISGDEQQDDKGTSRMVECAILLAKLGADFRRKFVLDPPSKVCGPSLSRRCFARIGGKTAQQLARMAHQPELVKAMEELQSKEKLIALARCRRGPRLPCKECHAGNDVGKSPFHGTEDLSGGRLWHGDIHPQRDARAKMRKRHTTNVAGRSPVGCVV